MNNKGFTLIELLATIVLLSLVVTISTFSIITLYRNSQDKVEKVFKEELSSIIDDYITMNVSSITCDNSGNCNNITFQDLIDSKLTREKDLINPKNKEQCSKSTIINIKRKDNYVYCYNISNLSCLTTEDKSINTCN